MFSTFVCHRDTSPPRGGCSLLAMTLSAACPDMVYFGFADKLCIDETIRIFNFGKCRRDFTYITNIVEVVLRVMQDAPEKKTSEQSLTVPSYAMITSSETRIWRICWIALVFSISRRSPLVFCLQAMTLRLIDNWLPCIPAMCRSPMWTPLIWSRISDSGLQRPRKKVCENLPNGIRNFIMYRKTGGCIDAVRKTADTRIPPMSEVLCGQSSASSHLKGSNVLNC